MNIKAEIKTDEQIVHFEIIDEKDYLCSEIQFETIRRVLCRLINWIFKPKSSI